MKKNLLALCLLCGLALNSHAQSKSGNDNHFSIGLDIGTSLSRTSNYYEEAIGGSVKYDLKFAANAAFTLSAGYTVLTREHLYYYYDGLGTDGFVTSKTPTDFIPLKAGFKYWVDGYFYAEAQLGATFCMQSGNGTAFTFSPGIGYKLSDHLDLGVRYESWSHNGTFSQAAGRLAYSF
jgi:hypothetical protein